MNGQRAHPRRRHKSPAKCLNDSAAARRGIDVFAVTGRRRAASYRTIPRAGGKAVGSSRCHARKGAFWPPYRVVWPSVLAL
jgi:hypothetical protein